MHIYLPVGFHWQVYFSFSNFLPECFSKTFINIYHINLHRFLSFSYCYEIAFCQFSIKRILDWIGHIYLPKFTDLHCMLHQISIKEERQYYWWTPTWFHHHQDSGLEPHDHQLHRHNQPVLTLHEHSPPLVHCDCYAAVTSTGWLCSETCTHTNSHLPSNNGWYAYIHAQLFEKYADLMEISYSWH